MTAGAAPALPHPGESADGSPAVPLTSCRSNSPKARRVTLNLVRGRGLEPLHHCWRQDLNLVRLPISPPSQGLFYYGKSGAGEGNRTLVISLEGFCSTIELHPRNR